jgi:hypothetical protein
MKEKTETSLTETKPKEVILEMDFGKLYCRVKGNDILRPVKAQLGLYEEMGQIYQVKKDWAITHSGYLLLNKVASINLVTPQKVMVDERERPNPFIERNPKTKLIETVNIRKIGVGFSTVGNVVVVDKTLLYNLYAYFIESVQSKMKKVIWKDNRPTKEKLHPDCAIIGTEDEKPKKDGRWAFFETVSPLGLWMNYEDPAIIDCLNEHTQKQRFGDRIASTIVERNILKTHPAIGISKVQPQEGGAAGKKKAFVTVYGYRHEFGPVQIDEILAQAEAGSKTLDIEAEVIQVEKEEEAQAIDEVEKDDKASGSKREEKTPAELEEPPEEYYEEEEKKKAEAKK